MQCSVGGSGGSNGGAVCWCGRPSADPRQFRPFYSLLPQLDSNTANGKWGRAAKRWAGVQRAYRANQPGYCCFTRTETRANVLQSLADPKLGTRLKSSVDEWLATMI